jgi:hypothetical protein
VPSLARALLVILGVATAALAAEQTLHRDADFAVSRDAATPPQDASWRHVILPNQWKADRPGDSGPGWYRVTFQVSRPGREPWMVYLPRLREGGVLYVNGHLLARVPEPDAKTWVRWMRPHAFPIPPDELRPGENILHVRINPANRDRIISSIHIGPDETVRPLYESRFFLTYTLAQIISAVTLSVALFVIALWLRRRMELDYGLFGLACLFWGVHTLNYVIEAVPDPWWIYWRVLRYAATGGFAVAITLFYLRFAGIRPRGMTRAFAAYWLSGPLALAIGGAAWHPVVDRYYQGGLLLMGLVPALVIAVDHGVPGSARSSRSPSSPARCSASPARCTTISCRRGWSSIPKVRTCCISPPLRCWASPACNSWTASRAAWARWSR